MSDAGVPTFVGLAILMTDEGKAALNKGVQDKVSEMFKDKAVLIDCPYALAVEYGTTPAKKERKTNDLVVDEHTGDRITRARYEIRKWVGEKEKLSGKERAKAGDAIYKKIMEEGAAPHPYIRPAIEDIRHMTPDDILARTNADNIIDAYALALAEKMVEHLKRNRSEASGTLIKKSIKVIPSAITPLTAKEYDPSEERYNWKPGQVRR